eukprot:9359616-Prorocentrum_lima.AAC.1
MVARHSNWPIQNCGFCRRAGNSAVEQLARTEERLALVLRAAREADEARKLQNRLGSGGPSSS